MRGSGGRQGLGVAMENLPEIFIPKIHFFFLAAPMARGSFWARD